MTSTERQETEQRIQKRGTPENLARFREVHADENDGEPIPPVDTAAYFNVLKSHRVEQFNALRLTFHALDQINDERLPITHRRSIAEAMRAAVEALPQKRLAPIGQTVEIYSTRSR